MIAAPSSCNSIWVAGLIPVAPQELTAIFFTHMPIDAILVGGDILRW